MSEQIFWGSERNEEKIPNEKDGWRKYLIESARWAKFIGIVSYVVTVILFLAFLISLTTPLFVDPIYTLFSLIVVLVSAITLEKFGSNIIKWFKNKETEKLQKAFFNLKNYFMLLVILFIIVISLRILAILL